MAESSSEEEPARVTPEMVADLMCGQGTDRERELILRAIKDPHSEIHDWFEGMEGWSKTIPSVGKGPRRSPSEAAGDQMIYDAVLRQNRKDVVAFLQRKRSQAQIGEDDLSKILAVGEMDSNASQPHASEDYARSALAMLTLTVQLHPALTDEVVNTFLTPRGRNPGGRGSP